MAKTAIELVKAAQSIINEVDIDRANELIADGATALDIRESEEVAAGMIPNAHHIARGVLEFKIGSHAAFQDKQTPIVIYCRSGNRSALAAVALAEMGFTQVYSMAGGYQKWQQAS